MNELATELRRFVDENFLFGVKTQYFDDDSFLENSIIDSTGVLELVSHVETTYDFRMDDEELIPENLDSVANITAYILRKQGQSSA